MGANVEFFCDRVIAHGMKAGGRTLVINGVCQIKVCENLACEYQSSHGVRK
jgi:hypothetical protein